MALAELIDRDQTDALCAALESARSAGQAVWITGAQSKASYGNPVDATPLAVDGHCGIVHYEPTELVITARAGTPLAHIEQTLAEQGQMLAFEPPQFHGAGTLGGAMATGLSGPRRPYVGSARDMILGLKLLNADGEVMRFGGEVMKNVAGYDVARLNVGALGTLGVIMEASLKVLPAPPVSMTCVLECPMDDVHALSEQWLRAGRPLSGITHDGERCWVRLSGTSTAVSNAQLAIGGECIEGEASASIWRSFRDHTQAFFSASDTPLWRLSLPPAVPASTFAGECLSEWAGQQLWLRSSAAPSQVRAQAQAVGGSATQFYGPVLADGVFHPLDAVKTQLHQSLKNAFDPNGVFNPGRLYPARQEG